MSNQSIESKLTKQEKNIIKSLEDRCKLLEEKLAKKERDLKAA
jgi:myosin heavy subunit